MKKIFYTRPPAKYYTVVRAKDEQWQDIRFWIYSDADVYGAGGCPIDFALNEETKLTLLQFAAANDLSVSIKAIKTLDAYPGPPGMDYIGYLLVSPTAKLYDVTVVKPSQTIKRGRVVGITGNGLQVKDEATGLAYAMYLGGCVSTQREITAWRRMVQMALTALKLDVPVRVKIGGGPQNMIVEDLDLLP